MQNKTELNIERVCFAPREAFAMLGVSPATGYRLMQSGRLRALKLGKKTVIERAAIDEFLAGLPLYQYQPGNVCGRSPATKPTTTN